MRVFKEIGIALLELALRAAISLRYRVEVKGLEALKKSRLDCSKGILFLPNHPAIMDSIILFSYLWRKFRMRPLTVEFMYRNPAVKVFMKLIQGVPIPNFDTSVNQLKQKRAAEALNTVGEGLRQGESFLIYPAGNLKSSGKESIRGSSAVHTVLQQCPDTNIVLIRTTGLWGSFLSRAQLGRSPSLADIFRDGFQVLLKNLFLFAPRRNVLIEIESNPSDFPRRSTRPECNRYLENWYNRYPDAEGKVEPSEPVRLVSYSFWKDETPQLYQPKIRESRSAGPVSAEAMQKISAEIRKILGDPRLEISPGMNLAHDLGMDSLNIADLSSYLLKNYEIDDFRPETLETVQDVLEIAGGERVDSHASKLLSNHRWPDEVNRPIPIPPDGATVPEAFFRTCDRMGDYAACGDDVSGVLSFKKMKLAVLVLAEYFRTLPEERIAVMLPASTGAFIAILALQTAGKIPVMLNWTLGPRYLEAMMRISGAKRIITSWRFLDRLAHVDFGATIDQMQFLEDIREALTVKVKLKGAINSKRSARALEASFRLDQDKPCVILFTSGTEAQPKCVPLSHSNVLSCVRPTIARLGKLQSDEVAYATLPPFHSFGFVAVGLLSILSGAKTAFYPDPTDGASLAEGIDRWKATVFPSPPSFIKRVFGSAREGQLKTVRIFISGAEKAPREILERIAQLGVRFIEGYGITECSSTVTATDIEGPSRGLGKFLYHYEHCTIHPETTEILPEGEEGEICLRGPNVFGGYLGEASSPFIERAGKKWYRTGDLGRIDSDGYLFLSGRLKRFAKLGGEMISLGAVEEALSHALKEKGGGEIEGHSLAVCAEEEGGKARLVLFTVPLIEKEEANEFLKKAGFSNLIKISEVRQVKEIPVLATGKLDYRQLQSFLKKE
jgi:long-chain-fatty-acid--[acyl-carrier-protein] ligase